MISYPLLFETLELLYNKIIFMKYQFYCQTSSLIDKDERIRMEGEKLIN